MANKPEKLGLNFLLEVMLKTNIFPTGFLM